MMLVMEEAYHTEVTYHDDTHHHTSCHIEQTREEGMQRGDVASQEEVDDRLTWVNSVVHRGMAPWVLIPVGDTFY